MLRIYPRRWAIEITIKFKLPRRLEQLLVAPVLLYRLLRYGYTFRRIPLTQGKHAIVDPDDYFSLIKHKWHAVRGTGHSYYAVRAVKTKSGRRRVHMHRTVIKVPDGAFPDHINRNGIDNRKANLRPADNSQNARNRAKYATRRFTSRYKGVTWHRRQNHWRATIQVNKKPISLGQFTNETQAAKAYDRAAKRYHGQYACLNFPPRPPSKISKLRSAIRTLAAILILRHSKFYILHSNFYIPSTAPSLTPAAVGPTVAPMAKTLYIIDGHAHIYAAYYARMTGDLTAPSGEPTKATYIFTMAMLGLIQRRQPDMLVVALDSKEPTFRVEIYPEYKANRSAMPDDLPGQIDRIEQILDAMNIPTLRLPGYEADDIIGTLAKKASAEEMDVYLCSKDKDLLQLLDERVRAFDIKKDMEFDVARLKEEMGVTPSQFLDALALQGDTSDNIPGLPDVGPKTALAWIQQYGSIENLYDHADEIKGKRGESLRNNPDVVKLSKELVTIDCNVPIEIDYAGMAVKDPDKPKLAAILTELGFTRLLTQLALTPPADTPAATSPNRKSGDNDHPHAPDPTTPAATSPDHTTPDRTSPDRKGGDKPPPANTALHPVPSPLYESPASAKTITHDYQLIDTPKKFETFFENLKKQNIFAVDTETTAILPMRADLVGISFSWEAHNAYYLPVKAPLGSKHLPLDNIRPNLAPILADENIKKIGQNIKYDMHILRNAGLPVRGIHFDTMVASYCLDPSRKHGMDSMAMDFLNYECVPIKDLIGKGKNQLTFDMVATEPACEYAAEDADITWQLYEYLKASLEKEPDLYRLFEQVEMPLVSVLATMERNGVSLDTKVLRNMSGEIAETLKTVTDEIYEQAETVFNIDSPKQLAEVLFDNLGLEPARIGKSGRSTDAAVLEKLAPDHPIANLILQYRTLTKLKNTYTEKLGALVHPRTNRVHASFNQTITATGRLSSSSPNLQNIPIRTELGRKIRSAFVPACKSDCILSADYSQIELRLLAHFSRDAALVEAFEADRDIHSFVASQIYGVRIEDVTKEMRSKCKAVNFGIIYGQGAFGLSRSIGMSMGEAKRFIDDYFARYSSIRSFMDKAVEDAKKRGYAETILHRRRRIDNLKSKNANIRAQAERLAVNTVIQGSAADLIKIAMVSIQRKINAEELPVKMVLQIHDELVFELPRDEVERHAEWIVRKMIGAIDLDVPMKVDVSHGPTWLA